MDLAYLSWRKVYPIMMVISPNFRCKLGILFLVVFTLSNQAILASKMRIICFNSLELCSVSFDLYM